MSKNLSVIKRIKTTKRNYQHNRLYKSLIKTTTKKSILSIEKMSKSDIKIVMSLIAQAFSKIDKAVKQGIIHKNKGSRKKSALSKALKKRFIEIHRESNLQFN